jgi:hypothetical protein
MSWRARLALPRSTIYYWVRDLPLRRSGPEGCESEAGREPPGQRGRSPRDGEAGETDGSRPSRQPGPHLSSRAAYEEALETFEELASQPTFRDFVCIYLVQGEQRDRTRVALTNSDPAVMRLVSRWLRRLTDKAPFLSLQYRSGQSLRELRDFWGDAVGAEPRAIRAARRKSASPGESEDGKAGQGASKGLGVGRTYAGVSSPHGLLTVAVEDSLLRARMQGWMHRARESWR